MLVLATAWFATLTGLACGACHTTGANLNDIGRAYLAKSNVALPIGARPTISLKADGLYSSDGNGGAVPRAIVDYIDYAAAGTIAPDLAAVVRGHAVDTGEPGDTTDAFLAWRPAGARVVGGLITLPLETDAQYYRELNTSFLAYEDTVGYNPFVLDSSHAGAGVYLGRPANGIEAGAFAFAGHDENSGLPSLGTDIAFSLTERSRGFAISLLHYDGSRPLMPFADRFRRESVGVVAGIGNLRIDAFYLHGKDTSALGFADAVTSSAAFIQVRADVAPHAFAIARYEGQDDGLDPFATFYFSNPGAIATTYGGQGNAFGAFFRQTVLGGGYTPVTHLRFTLEDAITHTPRTHHTLRVVTAIGASNARLSGGY
jgi:hypothetical protein